MRKQAYVADVLEESDHARLQRMLLAQSGWRVAASVTVGGGSVRMVVTLLAFIAGSVIGTNHWDSWQAAPKLAPVSLLDVLGMSSGEVAKLHDEGVVAGPKDEAAGA